MRSGIVVGAARAPGGQLAAVVDRVLQGRLQFEGHDLLRDRGVPGETIDDAGGVLLRRAVEAEEYAPGISELAQAFAPGEIQHRAITGQVLGAHLRIPPGVDDGAQ